MNHPYSKSSMLDLVRRLAASNGLTFRIVANNVNEGVSADRIKRILSGEVNQFQVKTDELIFIYGQLLNYIDGLKPMDEYFEPEEIELFKQPVFKTKINEIEFGKKSINFSFNPDRKKAFIEETYSDSSNATVNNIHRLFFTGQTQKLEREYCKDLADFSVDEYKNLLSSVSKSSFNTIKSQINSYVGWCVEKGLVAQDSKDNISGIGWDDIDNAAYFKSNYFKDAEDIVNLFKTISKTDTYKYTKAVDDFKEEIYGVVIPTICLLWLGFTKDETINIKRSDIDAESKSVLCSKTGKLISEINEDMFDFIMVAANLSSEAIYIVWDDSLLFSETISSQVLYGKISNLSKYFNAKGEHKVTYLTAYRSGIFYRMYQHEQNANSEIGYADNATISKIVMKKISRESAALHIDDYIRWKQAFYHEQ